MGHSRAFSHLEAEDFGKGYTRENIVRELVDASQIQQAKKLRSVFAQLPENWRRDRSVAFQALDLDPTGRVLQIIPEFDNDGKPLKDDRGLVMKALAKTGSNLKFVQSDSLRNESEVALTAVTQTVKAFKYIGDELKRDRQFVTGMLDKLISLKRNQICHPSVIDVAVEPKRAKQGKAYAVPDKWPGNLATDSEFGEGTFELPFGTDTKERTEETVIEIVTSNPYSGQWQVVEAIDETLLHDPDVLRLMFELDPVAVLFNDMHRKELIMDASNSSPSVGRMRPSRIHLVKEWHKNYERTSRDTKRLQCWGTDARKRSDDKQVGIADDIHCWIEAARKTKNPSLLGEAPKDLLTDEDKMVEAIKTDIALFKITPWKLRVSETFKAKLQDACPQRFLWITLEDSRAQIPSQARDSEMSEMIASFAAVQKRTGQQQHQVSFLQLDM
jgi:hypothetical protein